MNNWRSRFGQIVMNCSGNPIGHKCRMSVGRCEKPMWFIGRHCAISRNNLAFRRLWHSRRCLMPTEIACVIRQDQTSPSHWRVLDDAWHQPLNVAARELVCPDMYSIRLPFDAQYSKIHSFVVTPDEWMASQLGVAAGASVSLSDAVIQASGRRELYAKFVFDQSAQRWAVSGSGYAYNSGMFYSQWDSLTKLLTIDHDYCPGATVSVEAIFPSGCFPYQRAVEEGRVVVGFVSGSWDGMSPPHGTTIVLKKWWNGPLCLDGTRGAESLKLWEGNLWIRGLMS